VNDSGEEGAVAAVEEAPDDALSVSGPRDDEPVEEAWAAAHDEAAAAPEPSEAELDNARVAAYARTWLELGPPLAVLTTLAALAELLIGRVLWYGISLSVDGAPPGIFVLRRVAAFPRNVAGVAGLVALVASLVAFLRLPGFAPLGRRLSVAAFGGLLVPGLMAATFLPLSDLRPRLVVFSLAASTVVVALLCLTGVRYRGHPSLRLALGFGVLTAMLSLLEAGLSQLAAAGPAAGGPLAPLALLLGARPALAHQLVLWSGQIAEMSWLVALVAASITSIAPRRLEEPSLTRIGAGVAVGLLLLVGGLVYADALAGQFRVMLYGSFRLSALSGRAPALYVVPLALALGAGLAGVVGSSAERRQAALGTLLWLAAGYSPHRPIDLLYFTLAAALWARAAQLQAPDVQWAHQRPWQRLVSRTKRRAA
jgi:hypothetical protein